MSSFAETTPADTFPPSSSSSSASSSISFPPQKQCSVNSISKDGKEIKTDIVCTTYSDRVFVIITQIKKFGTIISAWAENKDNQVNEKSYHSQTLLGKRDDPLLAVYARQVCESIVSTGSEKPLLLAISIRDDGRDVAIFKAVMEAIDEIKTW